MRFKFRIALVCTLIGTCMGWHGGHAHLQQQQLKRRCFASFMAGNTTTTAAVATEACIKSVPANKYTLHHLVMGWAIPLWYHLVLRVRNEGCLHVLFILAGKCWRAILAGNTTNHPTPRNPKWKLQTTQYSQ